MRVDKTEEWKDWVDWKITRHEHANSSGSTLPVYNQYTDEWLVFQPGSSIYMSIPGDEFFGYKKFKTRYNP